MGSGFHCIGLHRPKTPENVGSVLRAAHCYGTSFVAFDGGRVGPMRDAIRHGTNTPKTQRHMPVFEPDDVLDLRPYDTQIVVVDLIPGAIPLHKFQHPQRAMYIFGPEDGTLGRKHTDHAQHVVYIPTRDCMNLAATVNVVLYDRAAKRDEWQRSSGVERQTENLGVVGSIPAVATSFGVPS